MYLSLLPTLSCVEASGTISLQGRKQQCSNFHEQNAVSCLLSQSGFSLCPHLQRSKSDLQEPYFDWPLNLHRLVTEHQCMRRLLFPGAMGQGQNTVFVISRGQMEAVNVLAATSGKHKLLETQPRDRKVASGYDSGLGFLISRLTFN